MRPSWLDPARATPADHAACRALLRDGSKSFHAASLLLPPAVRGPATALYAFCRLADDAADRDGGRPSAVARLRERLGRACDGRPAPFPADRALAEVLERFAVPRGLPEALFEGFGWDAEGRRYEDLPDLHAYAARVAGSVGAMMALVMGARAPEVVARACDLGVAMQLTNIARDVGEDARAGRLYLPLRWLREAGIEADAWLARPVFDPALGAVVRRLLDAAEGLYERAGVGVGRLPVSCRPGIHAARLLYREIGREVERRGWDSVTGRAAVPTGRKLVLLARAIAASSSWTGGTAAGTAPPLDATRFLVDTVAAAPSPPAEFALQRVPWWHLDARAGWIIDLFERIERREQLQRPGGGPSG